MYCAKCGKQIDSYSKFCHYCGKQINKNLISGKTKVENKSNQIQKFSNGETKKHLTVMYLTTFRLYSLIWFSNNWTFIKKYYRPNIHPTLRTLALFIPFLNLFYIYSQFKDIKNFAKQEGVESNINPLTDTITFLLLNAFFVGFVSLNSTQKTLNKVWEIKQPNLKIKKNFSIPEIIWIIIILTIIILAIFDSL